MKNNYDNQKGQSLVEALIAVSIILVGVISIVTLAVVSIRASSVKSGEVVALNLAREGLEVVKNMRDSNWLAEEDPWTNNMLYSQAIPYFDYQNISWSLEPTISPTADQIVYKTGGGLYYQSDEHLMTQPQPTQFRRYLMIDLICHNASEDENIVGVDSGCGEEERIVGLRVLSHVEWIDRGETYQVELEDRFYNWKPNVAEIY